MPNDQYDVGFKKPPKETQFKPGQSGNPNGRPKGSRNVATDLQEELDEEIEVTERGTSLTLTKRRALIKTLMMKGLKGEIRAAEGLVRLALALDEADAARGGGELLNEDDQKIIAHFAARLAKGQGSSDEES